MAAGGRADGVYEFGDFRLLAAQRREYWRERGSPEGCELEAERLLVRLALQRLADIDLPCVA